MSSIPWPSSFESLLRSYLDLEDGQQLTPDLNPLEHGLDSMATVSLLLDLEETYAVTIPDDQLARLASANVEQLWAILASEGATH